VTAYRHYWELCVLLALRDGLRSGDVHVPGSRRYADPAAFLLTETQWAPRRDEYCQLVGKSADGTAALAAAEVELHAALADLDAQLTAGDPAGVRLNADGELIIPPLAGEDIPAEADMLRDELAGILPVVPIASLLVEVDARTGFTGHLTHAGGKATRARELKRHLFYVLLAEAANMSLAEMAASAGVSYEVLAWTAEWYFRGETLEAANATVVNYHHELPFAQVSGHRHAVVFGWAAVPGVRQVDHRRAPVPVLRPRRRCQHLHRRLRSARHLRHQGDPGHRARGAAGAR
jgi:hypothetical protein